MQFLSIEEQLLAIDKFVSLMTKGNLSKAIFRSKYMDQHELRTGVAKHSWVVITKEWLDSLEKLTKGKTVLEVCAGGGWVSELMKKRGCKWIATDVSVGEDNRYNMVARSRVIEMGAMDAVSEFKPDIIFASWVDYESELDCELADLGLPMILVGEMGGCTGSDKFWRKYGKKVEDAAEGREWFVDVPQWYGLHDYTSLVHWEFSADFCVCSKTDLVENVASGEKFKYCCKCKKERV